MDKNSKIYIAGHKGLEGSAIASKLRNKEYKNIIGMSHSELDLTGQPAVDEFFKKEKPEYVFLAAARVGGIGANSAYPADFIMENELIQCNVIRSAHKYAVKKLLFFGSCCAYPKMCPQPIKEEYLLTGPLEPTNEAYALAKISGIKMCQYYNRQYATNYISIMPANLYGPNDNFDLNNSHVIPALIRKMHDAKLGNLPDVKIWGTGKPLREFLYIDDLADACVFLMESYDGDEYLNIGTGKEISIRKLAELVKDIIDFQGELVFDENKPDGTPRKLLDISKLKKTGWKYTVELEDGLRRTYDFFKEKYR